ncbi:hypothetical protein CYMTET_22864 [Cymbomonas tetramitiformis]|uniref:Uncharacterized protein n=1 Tax=Cymbomonas tetramitiformis TaxID=36881 RepID=A0AAE0FZK7_9CHLO|nr:hypothetical protein CYMTET_22864 [Cymbomonas tetramitiformis]
MTALCSTLPASPVLCCDGRVLRPSRGSTQASGSTPSKIVCLGSIDNCNRAGTTADQNQIIQRKVSGASSDSSSNFTSAVQRTASGIAAVALFASASVPALALDNDTALRALRQNSYSLSSGRSGETMEDVPQALSSTEAGVSAGEERLSLFVDGKMNASVRKCATKCVATCTRGGGGAPGLGPLSVRKEPVVFKEGFRSRKYCLSECTKVIINSAHYNWYQNLNHC